MKLKVSQGRPESTRTRSLVSCSHAPGSTGRAHLADPAVKDEFHAQFHRFGADLRAFRAQTDPSKLFFADYGLLEVSDEPRVLEARKAARTYVDVFKRTEIVPPGMGMGGQQMSWRRCVRCAAVMEDVPPGSRPGFTFVLSQQRRCACGGFWALLSKDI